MRNPLIVLSVLTSLVLPSLAWACDMGSLAYIFGGIAAGGALILALLTAFGVSAVLNFFEGYLGQEVLKPRFWILRLMSVGFVGHGLSLAIFLLMDLWMVSHAVAPGLGWTIALTSPVVLQSAYAAWTWHVGKQDEAIAL